MSIKEMYDFYQKFNRADYFINGFIYKKQVYFCISKHCNGLAVSRASSKKGGYATLRFRPNNNEKAEMVQNATMLMSEQEFLELVANSKYNKGEIFEKLITEMYGQEWAKDSLPFYEGSDLTVNEIGYQIKFQGATFCTEPQLNELMARA